MSLFTLKIQEFGEKNGNPKICREEIDLFDRTGERG
jgi:hypothetical protein